MTGAVNRDFRTCGSFADFVASTALDPRRADFVAGAALGEPRGRRSEVQILWQAHRFVNLQAQISWQA